ncbi:protocadherin gamma-B5-like [Pyxicephalus adspersus]|uniref:protocadherin gamma-B5-like n=1 Tax=Pyxicephalus adspersus TaxID=30357 RepID=UPI003B594848
MRKDSVIANIAKDLGLDIKQLSSRKLRIVSRDSEKYFYVHLDNGNLYVKDRIDRETLCRAAATCFLAFDAVVENPFNIFKVKIDIQDINDNPPVFYPDTFTMRMTLLTLISDHLSSVLASGGDLSTFSGQIQYSIVEEMRKDSVIANIAKDLGLDIKQLSSRNLRIVSRDSEKYFYVNVDNGENDFTYVNSKQEVPVENLIDADDSGLGNENEKDTSSNTAIQNKTLGLQFLSYTSERRCLTNKQKNTELEIHWYFVENPFNIFKVKIDIQDINDNPPVFYPDTFTIEINEMSLTGTRFALRHAEDPDIGVNSVQTYKLSDNSHFSLSQKIRSDGFKSPELVLEKSLDQESQNVHELILTALDGGNPVRSGTAVIQIIVTDVNDNFPIFSQEVYKVSVNENVPVNTTIFNVNATDKDAGTNGLITYSFTKTSGNVHPSGLFSIQSKSGEIKISKKLDYEETMNYELSVQAKDGGGLVSHCEVLVEVIDENDNTPEISITSLSSPISEDSAPGTMIAFIEVHDKDSGENGEVDCNILEETPFSLILSSENYYRIVTTSNLDRETVSSYNITVIARDRGSPPLSSRRIIRLEISDVNDNPPIFMKSSHVVYVPENNLPGASIYRVEASDYDYGENAKIFYSVYSEELPVSSYFSVNMENGVLYAQRSFDYEQHKEFIVQVNARDNGSPSLSSNSTLVIRIVDRNDNEPKILYPENGGSAVFEIVPIVSEPGSLITKVVAVDADVGHNAWLSYHFIQMSEPSYFTISEHSGEIRTSRPFQEKEILKHKVVVMVKDNGDPSLSPTVTINLLIADSFQQAAPKKSSNQIDENHQTNLQLYLVIAVAIISFLFIITVMLIFISKCKQPKPTPYLGPISTNLYPTVDPRILSMYSDGNLTLPYSYNVCVALDSCENDFTYVNSKQEVPVENLIDADDSGLGNENGKDTSSNTAIQVNIS